MTGGSQCPPNEFFQPPFEAPTFANYNPCFFPSMPMMSRNQEQFEQPLQKKPRLSNESSLSNNPRNRYPIPTMQLTQPNFLPMNQPQSNRIASAIFFKTRPCKSFEEGFCMHGEHCTFAHGRGELRQPPPNWQEIIAKETFGHSNDQGPKHKICKKFYNGERCPYGDKCNFLHVSKDTRPNFRGFGAGEQMVGGNGFGSNRNESFGGDGNGNDQRPALWKTKLCHKHVSGHCPYGYKCQYAHGLADLKKLGGDTNIRRVNFEAVYSETVEEQTIDAPPIKTQMQTIYVQETRQDKKLSEWKGPKKLSRVYGDWIDDLLS